MAIDTINHSRVRSGNRFTGWAALAGFLALASAVWVETDIYRYAALGLVLGGLVVYFFLEKEFRPSIGVMGLACMAWAAYVAARFAWTLPAMNGVPPGSSEGIYLLPIAYVTVGYSFFLFREQIWRFLTIFATISLILLVATISFGRLLQGTGERLTFFVHENLIHASVGGGLAAIASIFLALYLARHHWPSPGWRTLALAATLAVAALALVGIYGAGSRGVWFALVVSLPFVLVGGLSALGSRTRIALGLAGAVLLAALLILRWTPIWNSIGPVVDGIEGLASQVFRGGAFGDVVVETIAGDELAYSFDQRLTLWVKALRIWSSNWLFGTGIYWRALWEDPQSIAVRYNLMHNGFIEIGIRYGLAGLAFYAVLFGWALRQSWLCARKRLIAPELFGFHAVSLLFFALTLLSNSNNRLAIGESFMMMSAAFGFCCFYLLQWEDWERAKNQGEPAPDAE